MIIGRLGIDKGYPDFAVDKGECGCVAICTPLVVVTWYKKTCKCLQCHEHICQCPELEE